MLSISPSYFVELRFRRSKQAPQPCRISRAWFQLDTWIGVRSNQWEGLARVTPVWQTRSKVVLTMQVNKTSNSSIFKYRHLKYFISYPSQFHLSTQYSLLQSIAFDDIVLNPRYSFFVHYSLFGVLLSKMGCIFRLPSSIYPARLSASHEISPHWPIPGLRPCESASQSGERW